MTHDQLVLHNLVVYGYTGALPEEKILGQQFRIDLVMDLDLSPAAHSDDLRDTVDYRGILAQTTALVQTGKFDLIETLAQKIADVALQDARIVRVQVTVTKCHPPLPYGDFTVGVTVIRTSPQAGH